MLEQSLERFEHNILYIAHDLSWKHDFLWTVCKINAV